MAVYRVYLSASTQYNNIGVGNYGNEQDRMQALADRIKFWLETQGDKFVIFRNKPGWTLQQTAKDCNSKDCDLVLDNHTNAGPIDKAAGTECFYHEGSVKGKRFAEIMYKHIAPLSPGKDRGVKSDYTLYPNGLYILRETKPPACLIENFFHTNRDEVEDFLLNMDKYAKASAKAICEYFNEAWVESATKEQTIQALVDEMANDGIITDKPYWFNVLLGKTQANPDYLQIAFRRSVDKIK